MQFKFVSHGLWSEEQNILLQHMHKKEFWILINKCENKLKHENESKGPTVNYQKNRYAVAYMASTGSKTKNVNAVRFIFTFPTLEWGRLKYLGNYLPAL